MRARFFRVATFAAWFATDLVLAGEAAWMERPQGQKLLFKLEDFFIDLLRGERRLHMYQVSYI